MDHSDSDHDIQITIDGHPVRVRHGEHTGQQLRHLITPPAVELYLDVPDAPDAPVPPATTLSVVTGMRFFTRPQVQIFVNGAAYSVPAGTITDQQLRDLANPPIPDGDGLWLDIVDAHDDPIAHDELVVIEDAMRFFSRSMSFKVIVNGRPRTVEQRQLTFEQIVALAFPGEQVMPDTIHTITYTHAVAPKLTGSLHPGETLTIKNGTILSVTATVKS